jgi:hypothetical protein
MIFSFVIPAKDSPESRGQDAIKKSLDSGFRRNDERTK